MERIILFGGKSIEKEISVITALQAAQHYENAKLIYIDGNVWRYIKGMPSPESFKDRGFLNKCKEVRLERDGKLYYGAFGKKIASPDIALICCHGGNGENGSLAGMLAMCGVVAVNGSVAEQAVSMDKRIAKSFFRGLELPVVEGITVRKESYLSDKNKLYEHIVRSIPLPVVVKPLRGGSSIAVAAADNKESLEMALETAFSFDSEVIVERQLLNFEEVNVAVYASCERLNVSLLEKPLRAGELLDFEDKYCTFGKGGGKREFPYDTAFSDEIRRAAAKVYEELDGEGVMRADFMIEKNNWYINEINAIPGSLAYYLFPEKDFSLILAETEEYALKKARDKSSLLYDYQGCMHLSGGAKCSCK